MITRRITSIVRARSLTNQIGLDVAFACVLAWLMLATSLQAALVGYWNFDEATGTAAADASGLGRNGTLSASGAGATVPAHIAGRFGNALDFNQGTAISAGGLVTVPNHPDLLLPGAFTISFWWRPDYVPAASTFPGIMRIGTQGAGNVGWGFFRTQPNNARFKRNNHQPDIWRPTLVVGQWNHVALTHDGAGNNVAYVNGQSATFVTNWANQTSATALEFGRMDSFDNAGLDDVGLFNEGVNLAKMRSLYTVPTDLGLNYNLADVRALWTIFDAGPGGSGPVQGLTWNYTATLPGTRVAGEAFQVGTDLYVALTATTGVKATLRRSPGLILRPASARPARTPSPPILSPSPTPTLCST